MRTYMTLVLAFPLLAGCLLLEEQPGSCPNGLTLCNGICVDVETDDANCGKCGSATDEGEICERGKKVCTAGWGSCDGPCTDLASDDRNCGACGQSCPEGTCVSAGSCQADVYWVPSRPRGYSTCDEQCASIGFTCISGMVRYETEYPGYGDCHGHEFDLECDEHVDWDWGYPFCEVSFFDCYCQYVF
jgi:hypothetical protein